AFAATQHATGAATRSDECAASPARSSSTLNSSLVGGSTPSSRAYASSHSRAFIGAATLSLPPGRQNARVPERKASEMKVLDEKVAIVTGSARGIGRATAELLAEHGAKVLINDLDADVAEQTATEIGGDALVFGG